jgi:hypothetical protein
MVLARGLKQRITVKSWLTFCRRNLEKPMVCAASASPLAIISLRLSAKSASAAPDCT